MRKRVKFGLVLFTFVVIAAVCFLVVARRERFPHLSKLASIRRVSYRENVFGTKQEVTTLNVRGTVTDLKNAAKADLPQAIFDDSNGVLLFAEDGQMVIIERDEMTGDSEMFICTCIHDLTPSEIARLNLRFRGRVVYQRQ